MKRFSLKRLLSSVPKKTAAIFLGLSAILVPAVMFAVTGPDRPVWTENEPAPYVEFNSITNNHYWAEKTGDGNEVNFAKVADDAGTAKPSDSVVVQDGHTYTVTMLVHNNAAANLNLVAENVKGGLSLPDGSAKSITMNGLVSATNCGASPAGNPGNACQRYSDVVFTNNSNFSLDFVEGSAKYQNNVGTFNLSDGVIDNTVSLGYEKMDGKIPGCYEYMGYLTVKVTAHLDVPPPKEKKPSYDVSKSVDKATAKAGDTLTYTLTAKNTGEVDLTNVKLTDKLPANVTFTGGSFKTPDIAGKSNAPTGDIFGGGLIIPFLPVGTTATITLKVKAADASKLVCGTNIFTNVVSSSTDQDKTEDNPNNNTVTTKVNKDCPPPPVKHPKYDVIKTVDKSSANPADTIKYTLTVKNTGDQDLTNVNITDSLPAYYSSASETVNAPGAITGSIVKNGQLTIAKLPVGSTATITISYKIKGKDALECGVTTIMNKVSSKTDQTATEENLSNNSASTTVNKDCQPPKKEKCPYNPNLDIDDKDCKPPKEKCEYNPHLDKDDKDCKPPVKKEKCEYNPSLDKDDEACKPPVVKKEKCEYNPFITSDDPKCVPPEVPQTPVTPPSNPTTPGEYLPETIVSTGASPAQIIASLLATGVITYAAAAYLRSRKMLKQLSM